MSVVFNEDLDEYVDTDYEAESMKDNTLRNELAEILKERLHDHDSLFYGVDEAVGSLLSAIKNRLPKEADWKGYDPEYLDGYNTCLAEVKQALDIESEGASK